jgi:hypothetical protein
MGKAVELEYHWLDFASSKPVPESECKFWAHEKLNGLKKLANEYKPQDDHICPDVILEMIGEKQ